MELVEAEYQGPVAMLPRWYRGWKYSLDLYKEELSAHPSPFYPLIMS